MASIPEPDIDLLWRETEKPEPVSTSAPRALKPTSSWTAVPLACVPSRPCLLPTLRSYVFPHESPVAAKMDALGLPRRGMPITRLVSDRRSE